MKEHGGDIQQVPPDGRTLQAGAVGVRDEVAGQGRARGERPAASRHSRPGPMLELPVSRNPRRASAHAP
jgi:hypothetical protein